MKNPLQLIVAYVCMIVGTLVLLNTAVSYFQLNKALSLQEKIEKEMEDKKPDWMKSKDEDDSDAAALQKAKEKFSKHHAVNEVVIPGLQAGFVLLALGALLAMKEQKA